MMFNAQLYGQMQNVMLTLELVLVGALKILMLPEKPEMDGFVYHLKTKELVARHLYILFVHYPKVLDLKLLSMIPLHNLVLFQLVAPQGLLLP